MTDTKDRTDKNPARQTQADKGTITNPKPTDATMAERDLPRGSEKETHARK